MASGSEALLVEVQLTNTSVALMCGVRSNIVIRLSADMGDNTWIGEVLLSDLW